MSRTIPFYLVLDGACDFKAGFKLYNNKRLLNSALKCVELAWSIVNLFF